MGTIVSTVLQSGISHLDYFKLVFNLKCIASSPTLRVSSPFFTSIKVASIARNGRPRNSGTCVSSSISMTIRSIGKMNFPTLMSTYSRNPSGCVIVLSTIYKVIAVGVTSPKMSLLTTDKGIKLMLAPESQNAFLNSKFLMVLGMVKLPRSCIFSGKLLWITALHVAVKFTTHFSAEFLFLLRIFLKNLA